MSNHGVGGLKKVLNVVGFLQVEKRRMGQSPWCLAVPIVLVVQNCAACAHLENPMSNHGVGGLRKVVSVVSTLHNL